MMDEPSSIEVRPTLEFQSSLRTLSKRYRRIRVDVEPMISSIQEGKLPGVQIPGAEYEVYKVRIKNSDAAKGKKGGYRLIYWVKHSEKLTSIVLVSLYSKSDQESIHTNEIADIIKRFCVVAK